MHTPTSHARHADHQSRLMTTPTTQSIGSSLVQHYTPKTKYSAVRNHLTPGNAHYQNTPSPIANPFEADFDHLQHAIMTPGIFQKNPDVTPDSKVGSVSFDPTASSCFNDDPYKVNLWDIWLNFYFPLIPPIHTTTSLIPHNTKLLFSTADFQLVCGTDSEVIKTALLLSILGKTISMGHWACCTSQSYRLWRCYRKTPAARQVCYSSRNSTCRTDADCCILTLLISPFTLSE